VLTPSKSRVTPVCNRFARCGGCDLMHISYPETA
jgi:tRNA/tmRNA/rRNA uracil-C5-methylase (TrmA/RlmC/RlmD family)